MTHYDCCINVFCVFYEDVAECGRVVLISDNVKFTSKPTGKHESLSWAAGGVDTMGNMVYKAHLLHFKWHMGWWWCYSQTQM